MLRPFWQHLFRSNIVFGFVMILLFGVPRFILVLNANVTGNYNLIPIIFLFMWIAPFIFLSKQGRRKIGIKKPASIKWLLYAFVSGIIICAVMFLVAKLFYGNTIANWFSYISRTYRVSTNSLTAADRNIYFIIYSIIGITLSPIGEEFFYRGIVHESFADEWGDNKASVTDSLAFSLTHLAHFGIIYDAGHWKFLLLPALLWIVFMFLASRLFFICRQQSGSIAGAILCHAGFNFAMMYFIFYHILGVR